MIDALRIAKWAEFFDFADDPLLKHDPDPRRRQEESRAKMVERLRDVTGEDFGYDTVALAEQTEQVMLTWEQWWAEHRSEWTGRGA